LTLKREGGYGFLLFKSRIGPVKVFDAGEIHLVKGFKIECRTVLARDKIRTQTVTNGPQIQAKAKLAKADDPHLRAVSTLMDDLNEQGEETTRARASELNLSNLDQYCNLSTVDPKASIMDTTSASAKLSKKLKYSGQVFQFPNDETMDNHSKTNDTLLQETSFLDRSQVPVRADGHGSIMFGNILNDEMLRDPQDMFFKGRSDFSHDTDFQLKPKAELVSFGKQPTDRPSKVAVTRPSNEDEDEEPPWPGMEHAMGPIDTKALEVKVQKLGLQSNRKGETE